LVDKVTVYVDTVESVADEQAVCLVRALEGATTIGHVFTAIVHKGGASLPVSIRVDRIWRYGREVDLLDPAYTARLELGGSGLENLFSSGVLVSEANDVAGDGHNRQ
jgi:hypothetical protein